MNNLMGKSMGDANMGAIPIFSEVLARGRVARLEKSVGKFRTKTTEALAKLSIQCAERAALEAAIVEAREAVLRLSPEAQAPLLSRIEKAEQRLNAMKPACQIGGATPEARETVGPELSDGGDEKR
jgi:hypothetical protein